MEQAQRAWARALAIEPGNRIVRANLEALRRVEVRDLDEVEHEPADAVLVGDAA